MPGDHPLAHGERLLALLDDELSGSAITEDMIRPIAGALDMAERFLQRADARLCDREGRARLRAAQRRLRALRRCFAERADR